MAGRRAAAGLALAALSVAGCAGGTKTVTVRRTRTVKTAPTVTKPTSPAAAPCTGGVLSGSFALVPGSAGAGQIGYVLTLRNVSHRSCYVFGIPQVQLLTADGSPLPTHLAAARSRAQPRRVVLRAGAATTADARFSPDVPGPGDAQTGPCRPKASRLRVTPDGGGSVVVPIRPPTSVCEGGMLSFRFFGAAGA